MRRVLQGSETGKFMEVERPGLFEHKVRLKRLSPDHLGVYSSCLRRTDFNAVRNNEKYRCK